MNFVIKKKKSNKYKLISKLLSNKILIVKAFCDKPITLKQTNRNHQKAIVSKVGSGGIFGFGPFIWPGSLYIYSTFALHRKEQEKNRLVLDFT